MFQTLGAISIWLMTLPVFGYLLHRRIDFIRNEVVRHLDSMRQELVELRRDRDWLRQEVSGLREQVRQLRSVQESLDFRVEVRKWDADRPTTLLEDELTSVEKSDVPGSRRARTRFDKV